MSSLAQARRLPLRLLVAGSAALLLITTLLVDTAWSHGSAIDPPSRNYGCWQRWGDDFQNPNMAVEDPMCWQAWQADTNAMWNWNGIYIDGVGGDHQGAIPDGQLCSAGHTSDGRYAALDNPGPWQAAEVNNSFTVKVHDQALHGADYYRVYVTRQGFDPLTDSLGWGDLELVTETGVIPPGVGDPEDDPVLNGVSVTIDVNAPGRTGRHIVYTLWKASHQDQTFYLCSDVRFPGGPDDPPPTDPPPSDPPPSDPPPTTPPPAGDGACTASYTKAGEWPGGFQGDVQVTAGDSTISGWTVEMAFPNGQSVSSMWSATLGGSGSTVTASNMGYNGNLAAGQSAQFGFLGSWNGTTNTDPSLTCTAS
jgi:predicted carbohydrate-binding protein with CBM5 and CBM33 domain